MWGEGCGASGNGRREGKKKRDVEGKAGKVGKVMEMKERMGAMG